MHTPLRFKPALLALCTAAAFAASPAFAAGMSKAEYSAAKDRIGADYKLAKASCDRLSGNGKDVCEEEAEAKEKVAKAELEAAYTGKPGDRAKVAEVKADTAYEVAKERCDDLAGNAKDVCVQEAKAAHTKARADAKLVSATGKAQMEARDEKREANYKVEAEKCDALAGDAKSTCVADAKARYGKS
ncbi:MAG: hypothetical protein AB7O64_07370 [Methylibium sp.]|uniref:Cell envelope biogenesis protein TolA n=2 Tax=Methylibium TaxID=316612 RepID=A2SEK1_METPP|nr:MULTISPECIES: hypothetical protein [Methylibium]ABM93990.1 conserved hypothetical protein [Methylibium petroleiphilum PM1]EWS55680.1 hypothetical protein X551_01515 [Methylibium sp. T29]EWS59994.1 hypothetical protein Y694_02188 [Methylibium sp. T29-B]